MIRCEYKTEDKVWALEEAAKPGGFVPHARSTVDLLTSLEAEGFVVTSPCPAFGIYWYITSSGREWLKQAQMFLRERGD